jgi:hypothetical protein
MKKADIRVDRLYTAKVAGKFTTVRVDKIEESGRLTYYRVTNLTTGRKTTFHSAAKFRSEVKSSEQKEDERLTAALGAGTQLYPTSPSSTLATSVDSANPTGLTDATEQEMTDTERVKDAEGEQGSDPTVVESVTDPSTTNGGVESTSASVGFGSSNLAAMIAAAQEPAPTSGLTQQQQDILATAKVVEAERGGQRVMVVGAGAGCGKTFSLRELEKVLRGNGQYTAFNSSLVAESKEKFRRAACNTTHSLAFRAVGCRFKHRLGGPRVRSWEIAQKLDIQDFTVELPEAVAPLIEGKPQLRTLKAAFLAGQVTQAVRKFCQSADPTISARHFQRFNGLDAAGKYDNSDRIKGYLLPFAEVMWADANNPDGTLPYSHDFYVKSWELGRGADRPVIAADYILLDEEQDTAPVMVSILQQQTHAMLVLVGDENQRIYEWRGAISTANCFPNATRKLLSHSFRFGQAVADVANAVLGTLNEPTDLVMTGLPSIPSRVCDVKEPRCYLYRTNAGAIGRLMQAMDEGRRGHLIGGTTEVVSLCRAAINLMAGKGTDHPELGCFGKWAEVQEYIKTDEGGDLKLMVKLIDSFKPERIIKALDNMPSEDRADLVISTAHRSKGREWTSVRLGRDFKTANKLDDSERRLVYVACTRAQEELDLTECPTFCGGVEKTGDGEERMVPGIKINYTVPMPTAEQLADYRAAKSTPEIAPAPIPALESPVGQSPAPAPDDATAAKQAPSNGIPAIAPAPPAGPNTWAKGRNGDWLVRGVVGQTGQVEVVRKNGTKGTVTIKKVVWKDETTNMALYEV